MPGIAPINETLVCVRGGGDLASGAIYRLRRAGFPVVILEQAQPTMVRRAVAFGEAVYAGQVAVEGMVARLASAAGQAAEWARAGVVAVLVDPAGEALRVLAPQVVVDARLAKEQLDTTPADAPLVVALGPGFTAGADCHAVIETKRGHTLGRVYWQGAALPNTGIPEGIAGRAGDRVLRAPIAGHVRARLKIGDRVALDEVIAEVVADGAASEAAPIVAPFSGVLRGLIHPAVLVTAGMKVGDLDPRGERDNCFTISDKALAVGGGVLEAALTWLQDARA